MEEPWNDFCIPELHKTHKSKVKLVKRKEVQKAMWGQFCWYVLTTLSIWKNSRGRYLRSLFQILDMNSGSAFTTCGLLGQVTQFLYN
jgi:hypothetical protein